MHKLAAKAAVAFSVTVGFVCGGLAANASGASRPPLPNVAFPPSDPVLPPAIEQQAGGNVVRSPTPRDIAAIRYGVTYCKDGPRNTMFVGNKIKGKSFSATLNTPRFCHTRNRVSGVGVSMDHQLYNVYNVFMRFDHSSIERGFYNWRKLGVQSGYFVRVRFYFKFCYEPTRNVCTTTYTIFLRNYVHADGTSTKFQSVSGL